MNKQLQDFARATLKEGLAKCTEAQQLTFMRMYAREHLEWPINDVVDLMKDDKLDWAMQQVQNTLSKKLCLKEVTDPHRANLSGPFDIADR